MNNQILLVGKPDSSKTVFLTQFYSRLQKNKSKLSLYKPVANLSAISMSREALANGDEPQPTPAESHVPFELPILINGANVDLVCPDYGGEQVNTIIETRFLTKDWINAIKNSNNWILFIRLSTLNRQLDISDVTVTEAHLSKSNTTPLPLYTISEQTSFIELLQIFLDIKQFDYHKKNEQTKLTVVITCWDELEEKGTPLNLLAKKLPLMINFINSNWNEDAVKFLGLSALQFSLKIPENKERYKEFGPEAFGYLVKENGEETKDITELIDEALWQQ